MLKSNVEALTTWLSKTTLAQRIVLVIGGLLIVGMIGIGIYTNLPKTINAQSTTSDEKTVTVQEIKTNQETTTTTTPPAETNAVANPAYTGDMSGVTESNVTTVETPAIESEPVYTDEDTGGRYEAVQEETVYNSTPVASEPAASSSGGWDGNFGGTLADDTHHGGGDGSGTGVSN